MDEIDIDEVGTPDTVVVGGGLAGLLAAWGAAEGARQVVLVEPHPLGGRARADERHGFVLNRGPRALYRGGPAERALRDAGVDVDAGGAPLLEGAAARHRGTFHRFPDRATAAVRTTLLSPAQKAHAGRLFAQVATWRPDADDRATVAGWLDDRAAHGPARLLVEALVRLSTYADNPGRLAAAPALANVRAGIRPGVRYLDGGWQRLVEELAAAAGRRGVRHLRAAADSVDRRPSGPQVAVAGRRLDASTVVVAAGGPSTAAALLGELAPRTDGLGPASTAACLELGLRRPPRRRFVLGIDEPTYLSTHAPPARLAPDGGAVVHLMRYRSPEGDQRPADDEACLRRLAADVGIAAADVVAERFLARMVTATATPLGPAGGLAARPPVVDPSRPGIVLAGDWVGPEGLLADASAASAVAAAAHARARSATMVPR